jgi:hypothetical protein
MAEIVTPTPRGGVQHDNKRIGLGRVVCRRAEEAIKLALTVLIEIGAGLETVLEIAENRRSGKWRGD